jgi:altronate dehydratase large subunit
MTDTPAMRATSSMRTGAGGGCPTRLHVRAPGERPFDMGAMLTLAFRLRQGGFLDRRRGADVSVFQQEELVGVTRPHFLGFARLQGRAGIRNHLLVLSIVGLTTPAARRIARALAGARLVAVPVGRGQLGMDAIVYRRQIVGLASNPNVGAVLVVGADRKSVDGVAADLAARGRLVDSVALDDVHEDSLALSDRGIRAGARLAHSLSRQRREEVSAAELFVGIECGHSDATSGLVANPLAGAVADRLVDLGASAVVGETLEWLGAEHVLAGRARDGAVAEAVAASVRRREQAAAATGMDLLGNNPGEENMRGGLTTIEEKSLGAIAKAGSRPIQSLLQLGEAPSVPGLHLMDGPGFSPESLTGFAAAGAQIMLFTTGPGNSFCNALAPTLKISAHPDTAARLPEQIDFDGSPVLAGQEPIDAAADRLLDLVLDVASGGATWGEVLEESDEVLARLGPSF